MNKILFVENLGISNKDNPMSTCYILKYQKIIADTSCFDFIDLQKDYTDEFLNELVSKYDIVLFGIRAVYMYKGYIGNLKRQLKKYNDILCNIKNKYVLIQDMHPKSYTSIDEFSTYCNVNNINIIFTFFNCAECKSIRNKTPNVKHYQLCHHIDTDKFKDYNMDKIYDIFLFGATHPKHYPFRHRLFELINKNTDKFNVLYLEKPGNFDKSKCEDGLSRLINQSKITISTKSRYNYLLGKYFEIGASKSLIVGDNSSDGTMFRDKMVVIDNNMTDEKILEVLRSTLDNYESYQDKINMTYDMVMSEYNLDEYVKKLKIILAK